MSRKQRYFASARKMAPKLRKQYTKQGEKLSNSIEPSSLNPKKLNIEAKRKKKESQQTELIDKILMHGWPLANGGRSAI